ncbi:hypothetical protein JNUCC1_01484 [Lentibacillus sp. JNUCC-1]|uniref:hypothetical protein n=1 Tax=Lentibacillus sp. JNUCC-1 TaxID=2654513 RepID=UPI0012E8A9BC|nr:hypothetical protein [Lentibacillus sp. JNUCC-1]MUV37678.1 hypothetical protein [Lentibacillus sp. JNUCC-1]
MEETISLSTLKAFAEEKIHKKLLIKVMWGDQEKLTLLIVPNMKVNSFIYDEKEGYLFYNAEGKPVTYTIPCVLTEDQFTDGQVRLDGPIRIAGQPLSKEDMQVLRSK